MNRDFISPSRNDPEKDWRESLRRRNKARKRRFLLLAILGAVVIALVVFLLIGYGSNRNVPSLTPPAVSSIAETSTMAASVSSEVSPSPVESTSVTTVPTDPPVMAEPGHTIIQKDGKTIGERFNPPEGFQRVAVDPGSFAEYLRNYPLRPDGAQVQYYDGAVKPDHAYLAVADMDLEGSRLQQCADTVLRLHAEYLYGRGEHRAIGYHFVSGFDFRWDKWRQGYRVKVDGSKVTWVHDARADSSEKAFKAYLQKLFNYASTLSLEHYDMEPIDPRDLAIGDVFLHGGSPGHVVLVVDMAEEKATGRKCFILLQGYMPAQDAQILRNLDDASLSPWVILPENPSGDFQTPEYLFTWDQAYRFKD